MPCPRTGGTLSALISVLRPWRGSQKERDATLPALRSAQAGVTGQSPELRSMKPGFGQITQYSEVGAQSSW